MAVTLSGADRTLTASIVNFVDTLAGGTNGLTITGNLDLDGAATGLSTLAVSGTSNLGADVTTSSTQTYTGAVVLSTDVTLTTTDSDITFGATVDGDGTARDLTIDMDNGVGADGTVQFINTVGANDDLDVIDITGNLNLDAAISNTTSLSVSGTSNLGANVTTSSTQTYSDDTTISNNITLTTTNSNVSFGATTNAGTAGDTLTIAAGSGDVTFTDAVGGSTAMGNITITTGALSAAAIKVQGTIDITNTDTSSITGIISDGASSAIVTKAGSGTLTLSGNNTYTGQTNINAGIISITDNNSLGTSAGATIVAEGATLDFANVTYSTAEAVTVNGGTIATSTGTSIVAGTITLGAHSIFDVDGTQLTLSGNVTDGDNTYNITKTGDGILVLSNTTNSYDGTTTISTGTLTVIGRLDSGTYSANIINNSALIYNSASTQEFAGAVSGTGTLTKNGSSTLTLSNTNTYTGDTTISAGTIKLTGSVNALTDLSIASGATLDLQSTQTFATLDLDGTISNSAGSSELTITGASDIGGSITTSGTQDYEGAITLTDNTTLVSGDQITFDTTVNSEGSETNNLTVTATELQVDGIIGGTQTLGAISITGILDLNAAITNATSLSVSSTSNLGANVTTSSTQTYSDDVTISADISLNTSGGDVTFDGDVTSAVSGSSSSLIYYTTTPKRNGSGNIVYETGYGLGGSDAAASFSGDIDTVTYRMEYELGGTTYYAEATFDSWDGLTISDLKIPDSSSTALAIQRVVNNMSVSSNIDGTYNSTYGSSGVTTGSGKTGVLEIWYSNYGTTTAISGIGGSGSNYDYNDTRSWISSYGSFQVHNLTDTETVFAWNRHADNKPDVGFGNNTNSQHSDWTFQNNYNNETWALKVSVNNSVASNNLTISTGSGAVDINGAVANIGTLSITSNSTSSEASGIISTDTIITKAGSGTLLLSANNTYTGQTNINAGIISITDNNSLGSADGATIVADGASLSISNDITSAENITISGTGISSNGAIRNTADDNTLTGLITLGAHSEIQIDTGSSLTLNPTSGNAVTGTYNLTIRLSWNISPLMIQLPLNW